MQIRKDQPLSKLPSEVFDTLVGFEEEERLTRKQRESRRSLAARRAIERHNEEKQIAHILDKESWFSEN